MNPPDSQISGQLTVNRIAHYTTYVHTEAETRLIHNSSDATLATLVKVGKTQETTGTCTHYAWATDLQKLDPVFLYFKDTLLVRNHIRYAGQVGACHLFQRFERHESDS